MNDITKGNFEATIVKQFRINRKNMVTARAELNRTIINWSNGNWSIRRPLSETQELVANLIFDELEGSHGCGTFSVGDFLENWDDFMQLSVLIFDV